jgi:hypothetical protein
MADNDFTNHSGNTRTIDEITSDLNLYAGRIDGLAKLIKRLAFSIPVDPASELFVLAHLADELSEEVKDAAASLEYITLEASSPEVVQS